MHAGTCQVEGRVAGGGRGGGGALALWPGAPCGCGPTSCEREAHPSSHHVLCVIVCVVCRLMLLHAPKSYRSPGASSSGVCDTALERFFCGGRARACPRPRRRRDGHTPREAAATGPEAARGWRGGGGSLQARAAHVSRRAQRRRPLSAVARYVHKTSETSQWIIYTAIQQKTRCT